MSRGVSAGSFWNYKLRQKGLYWGTRAMRKLVLAVDSMKLIFGCLPSRRCTRTSRRYYAVANQAQPPKRHANASSNLLPEDIYSEANKSRSNPHYAVAQSSHRIFNIRSSTSFASTSFSLFLGTARTRSASNSHTPTLLKKAPAASGQPRMMSPVGTTLGGVSYLSMGRGGLDVQSSGATELPTIDAPGHCVRCLHNRVACEWVRFREVAGRGAEHSAHLGCLRHFD